MKVLHRQNEEESDLHQALLQSESVENQSSFEQTHQGTLEEAGSGNFFLKDKSINRFTIPLYPSMQNYDSETSPALYSPDEDNNQEDVAASPMDSFANPIKRAEKNENSL
jgi:hypothetical protein